MTEEVLSRAGKPRRRQLDSEGDYTQTLLNSLTLDQIREAIYRLAPTKKIQLRAHIESLDALVQTGESIRAIQQALLDIECIYPFKHCLLLRLDSWSENTKNLEVGAIYTSGDFQFTLSHIRKSPVLSLTFEHSVEFKEWIETEKDVRKRQTVSTRQPIIVRIQPDRNLLTLNYPGYSHNKAPNISSYESVVESLLHILSSKFGWQLKTLPIKNALQYFLEGPNKRVLQVKADVDTPMARLDVSAKGEATNIEEALASFIAAFLPNVEREDLVSASKQAFNSAVKNSIVLYWLQEGLFTRLRFWGVGTELFFVWNKEAATYRLVDEIASTLSETSRIQADLSDSAEPALSWITRQPPLSIITPGCLAQQFELQPSDSRATLLTAMKAGLVEPVYRISSSEMFEDFQNDWSEDLGRIRTVLMTVNGVEIDGTDPSNIEVAFQRVTALKERTQ